MSEKINLYSLTICARATLDLHSLNNEGTEGNQIQTRMVSILDERGALHSVNAISGDMWKHIQAEHLFRLSAENGEVPLCAGCRKFDANRINADHDFQALVRAKTASRVLLDELLRRCALDDIEGNLITAGSNSLPRKSVVEFGWTVGVPDYVTTDSHFHVKYARLRDTESIAADREAAEKEGANLNQSIFHRPLSSGIYAIVTAAEPARIGFNDITQEYAIDDAQRLLRHQLLLESLLYTFLNPRGAMRSTQYPHLVAFEGVIAFSTAAAPAPTVSPLKATYREEIVRVHQALEPLRPEAVTLLPFETLGEFAEHMTALIQQSAPYRLHYQTA
ncbi:MAG: DevR family CRISPR-associated autoregulator [Anaerolineae bacterium]|nr:DevR family CRISPR-associated autoregulator [Anaerolineae bacterium]MDW8300533.1 DevR family CRISPR-associated autoregulator [Anaerolineae bacterium]